MTRGFNPYKLPLVSVIIPTTDGEKEKLRRCVESVKASTYRNIEIVVVNEGLERSEQRNIGILRARGEYLLFLDSDQWVSMGLIKECVLKIILCSGIYIPEAIVTKGFFGYLRNWERGFYTGTPVDVVRFVRKRNSKNMCPLFDKTMSGPEDSDWDRRIDGYKMIAHEVLYHDDGIGVLEYLKKKIYYTKSMNRFIEKWPKDKIQNFWWRCFGVFFEDGKWRRVVARPDLFVCLMGLIFARGVIYLWARKS